MNENLTQREQMLAALSAVEQLLERTEVTPTGVSFHAGFPRTEPYSLDVSFYHRPEELAEFAADLGLPVTYQGEYAGKARPYIQAVGLVHGLEIRVWSLGEDGMQDRYRAVLAPAALPVEWSAAVSA